MLQSAQCHPRVFWHSKSSCLKGVFPGWFKSATCFWKQSLEDLFLAANGIFIHLSLSLFHLKFRNCSSICLQLQKNVWFCLLYQSFLGKTNLKNSVANTVFQKTGVVPPICWSQGVPPPKPSGFEDRDLFYIEGPVVAALWGAPTELKWVETEHMSDVCKYEYIHLYRSIIWVYNIISIVFISFHMFVLLLQTL